MDKKLWDELEAKKAELHRALADGQILLSEWFMVLEPILHQMDPALAEQPHAWSEKKLRELEDCEPDRPPVPGMRPRILVARSRPKTQKHLKLLLEEEGYAVTTTGDGIEALVELKFHCYDLIVTGSVLPHLWGFELLELKSRLGIHTPAVMQTVLPPGLALGLRPRLPLDVRDCICMGTMKDGSPHFDPASMSTFDARLLSRVKEHLAPKHSWT